MSPAQFGDLVVAIRRALVEAENRPEHSETPFLDHAVAAAEAVARQGWRPQWRGRA